MYLKPALTLTLGLPLYYQVASVLYRWRSIHTVGSVAIMKQLLQLLYTADYWMCIAFYFLHRRPGTIIAAKCRILNHRGISSLLTNWLNQNFNEICSMDSIAWIFNEIRIPKATESYSLLTVHRFTFKVYPIHFTWFRQLTKPNSFKLTFYKIVYYNITAD